MDEEIRDSSTSLGISFPNNRLLAQLYGEQDKHLSRIEQLLHVSTSSRGNILSISGAASDVERAKAVIQVLYKSLEKGRDVTMGDVEAAIRMAPNNGSTAGPSENGALFEGELAIKTRKKVITPYTNSQRDYIKSLYKNELVLAAGPAGTGKTYLAVAVAVSMFINHKVERIVLSRPALEAGEKLGFLPGDMKEKIDPYLRPLYDALNDMLPPDQLAKYIESQQIEIAPLAFMRGRTLANSFVILDEAQNTTPTQMKMFLTRLGEGSRMVVSGDLSQVDLPRDVKSGLRDAWETLKGIDEIGRVRFKEEDVVRHPLTAKIVKAYRALETNKWEKDNDALE